MSSTKSRILIRIFFCTKNVTHEKFGFEKNRKKPRIFYPRWPARRTSHGRLKLMRGGKTGSTCVRGVHFLTVCRICVNGVLRLKGLQSSIGPMHGTRTKHTTRHGRDYTVLWNRKCVGNEVWTTFRTKKLKKKFNDGRVKFLMDLSDSTRVFFTMT